MRKILALTLVLAAAMFLACGDSNPGQPQTSSNDSPTEAYKRLYAAIKAKNTDAIRKEMSAKTQDLAKMLAARQNKSEAEVLSNGFTATTFSPTLPEIRDERVKDNMGAIEVWNSKENRWEDLPYVREADGWKLAAGDLFAGTYKQPGKGMDLLQRESSNSNSPANVLTMPPAVNANVNIPANANKR